MTLKTITVKLSEIIKCDRFEPRFYYKQYKLNHILKEFHTTTILKETDCILDKNGKEHYFLNSGTTPKRMFKNENQNKVVFIKSSNIKKYNISFTDISYIDKETHYKQKSSKVIKNDVLIANTGAYLGSSCVYSNNCEANINQNIIRIRLKQDSIISPQYLSAFINSNIGQLQIESLLTSTNQKYLNGNKIKQIKIPLLDDSIMNKITKEMLLMERKCVESDNLINQAKQIFNKALNIDFSQFNKEKCFAVNLSDFKDYDLWTPAYSSPYFNDIQKEIALKFETTTLRKICSIQAGNEIGSENYIKFVDRINGDVPFIRTSDLLNNEIDSYTDFFVNGEIYVNLNQNFKENDIIFTKDGKIGSLSILTSANKAIYGSGVVRIRLLENTKMTQEYLFICLLMKEIGDYQSQMRTVFASTIPHLREDRIYDILIPILDNDIIQEITKIVKQGFNLKNEKNIILNNINSQFNIQFNY